MQQSVQATPSARTTDLSRWPPSQSPSATANVCTKCQHATRSATPRCHLLGREVVADRLGPESIRRGAWVAALKIHLRALRTRSLSTPLDACGPRPCLLSRLPTRGAPWNRADAALAPSSGGNVGCHRPTELRRCHGDSMRKFLSLLLTTLTSASASTGQYGKRLMWHAA